MARNLKIKDIKELYAIAKDIPLPMEYDIQKAKIAALNCNTQSEFLEIMEISLPVFRFWMQNSSKFRNVYNAWKEVATDKIERSLAKRAIGFTKKTKRDVMTKTGQVVTLENETYFPPDTAAAQFWLKNRAPKDWKDTSQVDVNVNANIRAWLVSAMGEGDDSELLDVSPGSVLALEPTETADSLIEGSAIAVDDEVSEPEPLEGPIAGAGGVASGQETDLAITEPKTILEPPRAFPEPVWPSSGAKTPLDVKDGDLFG